MGVPKKKVKRNEKNHVINTWKDICKIIGVMIGGMIVFPLSIFMAGLSIKAIVQNVQMQIYENKAIGTVTVATYEGVDQTRGRLHTVEHKYDYYYYVIEFDEETAGYDKYEEERTNKITAEKQVGDRYYILFNDIENAVLIQYDDVVTDNVVLIIFIIGVCFFVYLWKKLGKRFGIGAM